MKGLRSVLAAVVGVFAVVAIFLLSRADDFGRHRETLLQIQELRTRDAELDAAVLRSQVGLTSSYDELVAAMNGLRDATTRLEQRLADPLHGDPATLAPVQAFAQLAEDKLAVVERFKTSQAVARNSVRYLPTADDAVQRQLDGRPGTSELGRQLNALTVDGLAAWSNREVKLDVVEAESELVRRLAAGLEPELVRDVEQVADHALRLARSSQELAGIVAELESIDGSPLLDTAYRSYSDRIAADLARANRFRGLLLVISAMLIGWGIISWSRLRRARDTLEQRVDARTAELEQSTDRLREGVWRVLDVVSRAAAGDLSASLDDTRDDEIGQLSRGIDEMLVGLRALVVQVQASDQHVTQAVSSVSEWMRGHEASSTEHAATTMQVVATARQISGTSAELAETMGRVAAGATDAGALAADGGEAIERMQATVVDMRDSTDLVLERLQQLDTHASRIGEVVTTITSVSDQTNLLSLNAAIEAEKAGDYGRGFSVIAREIRRLADQTAVATIDIERTVEGMQAAVTKSVMGVDRFAVDVRRSAEEIHEVGVRLQRIVGEVQAMTQGFGLVEEGVRSQAIGARQISDSMEGLSQVAQHTTEVVRGAKDTIDRLVRAHQAMQADVSRFTVER